MRIMTMHKNDQRTECGEPPSMEIVTKMGAFMGSYVKSGRLIDGAGLKGSSARTRLRFRNGNCTKQDGPYKGEDSELPARMLFLKVATRDQAIGWAERFGKILGDCELELGKVTEPWDLGLMPEPPNPLLQFLLIEKGDEVAERTSKQKSDLTRLETEMKKEGILLRSHRLEPSKKAKRLTFKNNDLVILDGPFTESKELIGGFAVMELASFEEAIDLARRYAEILGGNLEIDLRLLADDTSDVVAAT